MLRILYQCQGFLPDVVGGAEVLSLHLLQGLQRRGHRVLVLTTAIGGQQPGHYSYAGIDLQKFSFGEALQSRDLPAIAALCTQVNIAAADFRADILMQTDTGSSAFFFLRRHMARDLPRLLTIHSPVRESTRDTLQNRLMDDADVIATVSQSLLDDAAVARPCAAGKLTLIRNALPLSQTRPEPLPFSPPTLLCIGRLVTEKGTDIAIQALSIASMQGCRAHMIITGDGPARARLQAMTSELGLDARVRFTGWVTADVVANAMNQATAVLVPSRWREPFGLVALEAAQMGRPVIASNVGGLPEIVRHGKTGLLVSPEDPEALAQAIINLLQTPQTVIAMGENARNWAMDSFDFEHLVDLNEAAILRTANAGKPVPANIEA